MVQTPPSLPLPANRLLASLSPGEYRKLAPLLRNVPLQAKHVLCRAHEPLKHVYFPTSGIISAMTVMRDGRAIEVATIGKEGLSGLTAFTGEGTSPYEVMVQISGEALRMDVSDFQQAARRDGPLREMLGRYHTAFSVQVSYSVACNGLHTIEKRCCRWLLMTQDRVGSTTLPLTHEFLAVMLGVRRASVTEVLRPLQVNGIVRVKWGHLEILDRPRMEKLACECYAEVTAEFQRLFD